MMLSCGVQRSADMAPRRPRSRQAHRMPDDLVSLAARCEYVGSVEHKDQRSWLGLPRPRRRPRDVATICPLVTKQDRDTATDWVREAITAGNFDPSDLRNGFPRKIWFRDEHGRFRYGFLTNQGSGANPCGQYKGWPIEEDEWREIFS